jgi:hypothetical protein
VRNVLVSYVDFHATPLLPTHQSLGPNPFLEPFWEDMYRQVGGLRVDLEGLLEDIGNEYFRCAL